MRPFFKMLASDLRYGLGASFGRALLVILFAVFGVFMSAFNIYSYRDGIDDSVAICLGDALLCSLGGMEKYVASVGNDFKFPMAWIALMVTTAYVALDYPARDLQGAGTHLIVAAGGRARWWCAKCVWTLVVALLCAAVPLGAAALVTALTGGAWDWTPTYEGYYAVGLAGVDSMATPGSLATFAAGVPLAVAAILLVQMALSVLVAPYAGLGVTVAVLFFSAYFVCPYLPGEYLMAARCEALLAGGVNPLVGMGLSTALGLLAAVLGGFLFCRRDIMGRKGDAR